MSVCFPPTFLSQSGDLNWWPYSLQACISKADATATRPELTQHRPVIAEESIQWLCITICRIMVQGHIVDKIHLNPWQIHRVTQLLVWVMRKSWCKTKPIRLLNFKLYFLNLIWHDKITVAFHLPGISLQWEFTSTCLHLATSSGVCVLPHVSIHCI